MIYVVPSRGRPHKAEELIQAFRDTRRGDVELLFVVDHDDPQVEVYRDLIMSVMTDLPWVQWLRFGRECGKGMVPGLNYGATSSRVRGHDIIGFMGDDHRPRTIGWDVTINAAWTSGAAVIYGNDLMQGPNLPTAVALDARIVKALGYMSPPTLQHLYVDNFWKELGVALGSLTYLEHVIIEHVHPIAGKAEWDDEYRRVNDGAIYAADAQASSEYMTTQFFDDVKKVKSAGV